MKRMSWLAWVAGLVVVASACVVYAQGGGGGTRRGPGAGAETGMGMMQTERAQMMLGRLGLNEQEQTAARTAIANKLRARVTLGEELGKLRTAAFDEEATQAQLTKAVEDYNKAMATYRNTIQTEDKALASKLSVRSRARCLAMGVLENETGVGGRMGMGGGRGMRRGPGTGPGGGPGMGPGGGPGMGPGGGGRRRQPG
jgi:hypothetical protein